MSDKIRYYREKRKSRKMRNLVVIKRSPKNFQALSLPKVLNLNPRSIYNKVDEFVTFVNEEDVDLVCMSESWERENLTLEKVVKIQDYKVISNVHLRCGKGGRPAIIANEKKFIVENLTQTEIDIPWGVEAVWAVLTPKNVTNDSKIKKIVVGSIYCKPDSRKKSLLLDHIAEVHSLLSSKYKNGLHWILCGDTNDLKLDEILNLNSNFKQVVQQPTRLNPPRILDPIITTLAHYYQLPVCLPPLDADPDSNGKPSDHLMVVMCPLSVVNNKPARTKNKIVYRPYNDIRLQQMQQWIENENWEEILKESTANKKMEMLQNLLVSKYQEFFPEKTRFVYSDTDPFFNEKLERIKRRKCREYRKHRKSGKWMMLQNKYMEELDASKKKFYRKRMDKLRKRNPKKWHSELKKLTRSNQHQDDVVTVESIKDFSDEVQSEMIATKFAEISQEYDKLSKEDIEIPAFSESDYPIITESDVRKALEDMDTSKSNVDGDIPCKILKQFSSQISLPLANALNSSIRQGCWAYHFEA